MRAVAFGNSHPIETPRELGGIDLTRVGIPMLRGERPTGAEKKRLGYDLLDGVLVAPRGVPWLVVAFDLAANAIRHVSARDNVTGREHRVEIQPSSEVSKVELQRMTRETEQHVAEGARQCQEAELKNRAGNLASSAEKLVPESGDRLLSDWKLEIESRVQLIRAVAGSGLGSE